MMPGLAPVIGRASVFPEIVTTSTGNLASTGTSHTITLPASRVVGNLIVVNFALVRSTGDTALSSSSIPAGWDFSGLRTNDTIQWMMATRVIDGSEGASVTFTSSQSRRSAFAAVQVGRTQSTSLGDGTSGASMTWASIGASTSPDAPSVTAPWGAAKNLWLMGLGVGGGSDVTVYPTGYEVGNSVTDLSGTGTGHARSVLLWRELETGTENPGALTIVTSRDWACGNWPVRPQ